MIAIKDAANITLCNKATKEPIFFTKHLNTFNLNFTEDSVAAKAKGKDYIVFSGKFEGKLEMETEVVSFDQLGVILSSQVTKGSAQVGKRDVLTSDSSKKVTLKGIKPVTGSISVFSLEGDLTSHKEKLAFTSSAVSENTEITISTPGFNAGEQVAVYYLKEMPNCKKIVVKGGNTSPNYMAYGDALGKDENGVNQVLSLKLNNLKAERNFELNLSAENPSAFKNTFVVLPDENDEYAEIAFIGEDAEAKAAAFMNGETIKFGEGQEVRVNKK